MRLLLASQSPRRQQLLRQMELDFELVQVHCDEEADVPADELALALARKKSHAYGPVPQGAVLLTADTTVLVKGEVLNKPVDRQHALRMLHQLQSGSHVVCTAVCLRSSELEIAFDVRTDVHFRALEQREMEHYVDRYSPMDKAGSYGIQEWIGLIGIDGISGCYYNVMGLPCPRLYEEIKLHFPELVCS